MMKVGATTKNLGKFDSRLESGIIGGWPNTWTRGTRRFWGLGKGQIVYTKKSSSSLWVS